MICHIFNFNYHFIFQPATLPISVSEISKLPKKTILKSGKKRNSSSNLLQDSDGSKSSRKFKIPSANVEKNKHGGKRDIYAK